MFFRQIYDDALAQAAYLIGCQKTGEAIVIDPERDIDRYVELAEANELRIVAVAETHIHADFLSGARQAAESLGATVYVSSGGGADWSYRWVRDYTHVLLDEGDVFSIGAIEFRATHTPGHTPEHVSYIVTDRGGGADEPIGMITGDFVFVGALGRPDLLETAVGVANASTESAEALDASAMRFLDLPEWLQVWPAHGAGSACGKALGAVPQSTVGYEKRFNPALKLAPDRDAFVEYILEGQPEPPLYFARMKVQNRDGVPLLAALPAPREFDVDDVRTLDATASAVVDTRAWPDVRDGHLPGSFYGAQTAGFLASVGSYVEPEDDIVLVIDRERLDETVRKLVRIGLDRIVGFITPETLAASGAATARFDEVDAKTLADRMASGAFVLDVRRAGEFEEASIAGAHNLAHTRLVPRLDEVPSGTPVVVHCRTGVRSACAVSMLTRRGYEVINLAGGIEAWVEAGLPVEGEAAALA